MTLDFLYGLLLSRKIRLEQQNLVLDWICKRFLQMLMVSLTIFLFQTVLANLHGYFLSLENMVLEPIFYRFQVGIADYVQVVSKHYFKTI
jgi:hypothetical protein